jgi:hypothetical protein
MRGCTLERLQVRHGALVNLLLAGVGLSLGRLVN